MSNLKYTHAHLGLSYYDVKALELALDGLSLKEIEIELCKEKGKEPSKTNYSAKEHLNNVTRRLEIPNNLREITKNREQVLKNLELYREHKKRLKEFLLSEDEWLIQQGFVPLNDW